ncbi:uncharacterized protein LOC128668515 [Microplitis demolitor]|uniref:uncharacterized protein LOC128668515 n=1 Tax=Microplitis demolitor TaxID=69319 RepID=UPI00235B5D4A|nr:uncharacterized protein LOC128668515 [Microplitis demolitor]
MNESLVDLSENQINSQIVEFYRNLQENDEYPTGKKIFKVFVERTSIKLQVNNILESNHDEVSNLKRKREDVQDDRNHGNTIFIRWKDIKVADYTHSIEMKQNEEKNNHEDIKQD